ncbi:hypothetical protein Tco_0658016 [Tanacetum coccineum]
MVKTPNWLRGFVALGVLSTRLKQFFIWNSYECALVNFRIMDNTRAQQKALDDVNTFEIHLMIDTSIYMRGDEGFLESLSPDIIPSISFQIFEEPPLEEEILSFIRDLGHTGEIKFLSDVNVQSCINYGDRYAAIINNDEEDDDEVGLNDDEDDSDDDEDNDDDDNDADNQDDDDQEDDGQDDEDQDDVNEQNDSDNVRDKFVHPKLSTQDQKVRHNEEESYEESDEESDEEIKGANVEEEELDEEETNDEEKRINYIGTLKTLENDFSEFNQTNQFAAAVASIPDIVDTYLANKMNEGVKIADQVKEQVKAQVSKILPKIEKTINEQLKADVLTRSSNKSKTSYVVAANLSELELKKILIDKMESNKRRDDEDKDEEPSAGSNRGSKRRRAGKKTRVNRCTKEKRPPDNWPGLLKGPILITRSAGELLKQRDPKALLRKIWKEPHIWSSKQETLDNASWTCSTLPKLFRLDERSTLRIQDIKDVLLLLGQGKLTNLTVEERLAFNVSLSNVYKKRSSKGGGRSFN